MSGIYDYCLIPRINERTREKSKALERTTKRILDMSDEERNLFDARVQAEIVRTIKDSYEIRQGELRTLAKMNKNYITNGFIYKS